MDRAVDGTPLYAPRGELACEVDGSAVQCHLCGRWYRDLASSHLPRTHQLTASEYRDLVGLRPRHPLQAPARSAAQRERLRRRIAVDARLQAAMAVGAALARRGELQPWPSGRCASVRRRLSANGSSLRQARNLERSARSSFAHAASAKPARSAIRGLEDFCRRRYRDQRARLDALAAELACAQSAVRGDLRHLRLGLDRARSHGARWR